MHNSNHLVNSVNFTLHDSQQILLGALVTCESRAVCVASKVIKANIMALVTCCVVDSCGCEHGAVSIVIALNTGLR